MCIIWLHEFKDNTCARDAGQPSVTGLAGALSMEREESFCSHGNTAALSRVVTLLFNWIWVWIVCSLVESSKRPDIYKFMNEDNNNVINLNVKASRKTEMIGLLSHYLLLPIVDLVTEDSSWVDHLSSILWLVGLK